MHETGSSSTNSLDKFICSVAEQSFCHRGFLLGSPRTGWRDPNSQTTCLLKALYSTKEKVYKLRNFNASAIRAPPTATHATLPALIARELEIVRGASVEVGSLWSRLINLILVQTFIKIKHLNCFMNQESKLDCFFCSIYG